MDLAEGATPKPNFQTSTLVERLGDTGRAHVGVRGHDVIAGRQDGSAGLPCPERFHGEGAGQIVAFHDRDPVRRSADLLSNAQDAPGRCARICGRQGLDWIAIPPPIARKHALFIGEFLVSLLLAKIGTYSLTF